MNEEFVTACKTTRDKGLVIHLRAGDVLKGGHAQSRVAPCAFYDVLLKSYNFSEFTIVTEGNHPCKEYLVDRYNGSKITVTWRKGTKAQDACSLMKAQDVAFGGLSSFSETLTLLSDKKQRVFAPSQTTLAQHCWVEDFGSEAHFLGTLSCHAAGASQRTAFELYDFGGFADKRNSYNSSSIVNYVLHTPMSEIQHNASCDW